MNCQRCGALNPAGMRYCGMCGRPLHDVRTGRERRWVSVMFVDLAAFSEVTRDQDPEELRDLADEVLTVVAAVVEEYDGYVDAFRGDGLIALFGAPHSHADDPERAVRAAASSLRAIERIGAHRGIPLRGRAGVNTGVVIAGAIGSGRVRDYTVMGSAVNLAARLEAAARPGEVWVGPETFEAVRHRVSFEETGPVTLHGFPDVTRAYRVRPLEEAGPTDPFGHLAFVGREEERARLWADRDEVVTSWRPRVRWLAGEAGSGKTRLLHETFGGRAGATEAPTDRLVWLRVGVGEEMPWSQLASVVFGVDEAAHSVATEHRVQRTLAALLPEEPRWHREILASMALLEQATWRRLDRRSTDRTSLAWRDLLAAYARTLGGALILVVDDDPGAASVDQFVSLLLEKEAPILVVRTARLREVPSDVEPVHLAPLPPEACMALVRQLIEPAMVPAARSLVEQLGGTPSHLIELGRALSLQEDVAVSLSLASLLQARLDRSPPSARQLLAHAALVGERVWDGLLRELSPEPQGAVFEQLVAEDLLVPVAGSSIAEQREYRFQSELLRRAVMRMVPFSDRPHVHVRIATWLEERAPLALSETIGEHFRLGQVDDAAYAHFMAAAEQLVSEGALGRADALFERASSLEVPPSLRAQALLSRAQHALESGDASAAAAQVARAEPWIARSGPEAHADLSEVRARLERELAEAG